MAGNDETLRDKSGRWLKGTPPPNPQGRPAKADEIARIQAVQGVVSPDVLSELLQAELDIYRDTKQSADRRREARDILLRHGPRLPQSVDLTGRITNDILGELSDDQIDAALAGHDLPALGSGDAA